MSQVDIPLAPFFIGKLLGRKNYFDELHGLDPQLHKSLLQIKKFKGDVEDLCLDFTVSSGEMMGHKPLELFPGGASVNVTNSNRHQYVHLVADYRLNQQIALQCRHFIHGFSKVCVVLLSAVVVLQRVFCVCKGFFWCCQAFNRATGFLKRARCRLFPKRCSACSIPRKCRFISLFFTPPPPLFFSRFVCSMLSLNVLGSAF